MPTNEVPFWAIFTTLNVRGEGTKYPRVFLRVRCGTPGKAERLRLSIPGGRRAATVVIWEGRELPGAMRALGYPTGVVDAVGKWLDLKGKPGILLSEQAKQSRKEALSAVKLAVGRALRAL